MTMPCDVAVPLGAALDLSMVGVLRASVLPCLPSRLPISVQQAVTRCSMVIHSRALTQQQQVCAIDGLAPAPTVSSRGAQRCTAGSKRQSAARPRPMRWPTVPRSARHAGCPSLLWRRPAVIGTRSCRPSRPHVSRHLLQGCVADALEGPGVQCTPARAHHTI